MELRAWAASEEGGSGLDVQVWGAAEASSLREGWAPVSGSLSVIPQGFSGQQGCCGNGEGGPAGARRPA